ncbi:hypothetical protein GSI_03299 [Ganoderma sinense ZZ0214-1]|uniref:Uncharacterized protein n=1 Tax=Ganoderma sinense ZZ0214-1 TaxID=1077348 RepID=A0A2G8SL86_9APHY|nr:hypothetical protein GSI_03299 [Ganoderma sinense ZZ0214-1]
MCMYTMLVASRHRQGRRNVFLIVAFLFFLFATLDVALLLRHVLVGFIWYHGPGGAIGEFSDISYWVNVMKTVAYVAQTSIGDGMLIYRCYVVYGGHGWLVAAPLSVLWVAGIVVSVIWAYIEFTFHTNALLDIGQLKPFITSTISITLALNLAATSLIVHKICVVAFFAVYLASNNAQYGVSDCIVQIIGIAFNLIIIRVDQGKALEATGHHPSGIHFQTSRHTTTFSSATVVDHGGDPERNDDTTVMMTLKDSPSSSSDPKLKDCPGSPV